MFRHLQWALLIFPKLFLSLLMFAHHRPSFVV
nr:MAG TPA: hypothetical protein [Caudoviricetes sp.]